MKFTLFLCSRFVVCSATISRFFPISFFKVYIYQKVKSELLQYTRDLLYICHPHFSYVWTTTYWDSTPYTCHHRHMSCVTFLVTCEQQPLGQPSDCLKNFRKSNPTTHFLSYCDHFNRSFGTGLCSVWKFSQLQNAMDFERLLGPCLINFSRGGMDLCTWTFWNKDAWNLKTYIIINRNMAPVGQKKQQQQKKNKKNQTNKQTNKKRKQRNQPQ